MCHVRHRRASQPEACLSCPRFSQHQCGVNICPVATQSDHAVAHTSPCSGCYVRRRWSIGRISGYSHGTFRRGGLLGRRFNPAPGWPPPPPGFVPPPYWQPDPSWPPAPPGWQLWVDDGAPDPGSIPARPGEFGTGAADVPWADLSEPPSGPLTGPPTRAYVPGATGPQDPFGPGELFGPRDPFARQGPADPLESPDGPDRPGHRARTGKTDGFAIASLLLGVFGITVIGAILSINFGIMALRRVRRTGQPGRGLAIAGLIFSAIWLLIGTFFVLGAGKGPSQPSASGGPSSSSSGHSSSSGSSSGGDRSSPTAKPSSSASRGSLSTNV